MTGKRLTITLDTNTLPLEQAMRAIGSRPFDVQITSITAREIGSKREPELSLLAGITEPEIAETAVMDESQWDVAVFGSDADADLFEKTLVAITNGSFHKRGARGHLTAPQRRQMRDAMIFCAHVREKRDIFVTNDVRAFGAENTAQRQRVETLAPATRIMTLAELERFCRQTL
jgi:hypothetical protein